jgi:hypothetical protein
VNEPPASLQLISSAQPIAPPALASAFPHMQGSGLPLAQLPPGITGFASLDAQAKATRDPPASSISFKRRSQLRTTASFYSQRTPHEAARGAKSTRCRSRPTICSVCHSGSPSLSRTRTLRGRTGGGYHSAHWHTRSRSYTGCPPAPQSCQSCQSCRR